MTNVDDVVDMIEQLTRDELEIWIKYGWVKPLQTRREIQFNRMDIARIRLIADCRFQLDIEIESIDVVLTLLDQVYGLRSELKTLVDAINMQPIAVRNDILNAAMNKTAQS